MKIISWNVRGLGRSRTFNRLRNKLRAFNPRILILTETKLSSTRMEAVRKKCGFRNEIDVGSDGSKGGLSLGLKGNSLMSLRSFLQHRIDVDIHDSDNDET